MIVVEGYVAPAAVAWPVMLPLTQRNDAVRSEAASGENAGWFVVADGERFERRDGESRVRPDRWLDRRSISCAANRRPFGNVTMMFDRRRCRTSASK